MTPGTPILQPVALACDSPALAAWAGARNHAAGALGLAPLRMPSGVVLMWRLLAANNRELARSAQLYDSVGLARQAATELQRHWAELEPTTFHGPVTASHGWAASVDGLLVLTCARWYETGPISMDACRASIASLRTAQITRE
jgi:hypothetical protein